MSNDIMVFYNFFLFVDAVVYNIRFFFSFFLFISYPAAERTTTAGTFDIHITWNILKVLLWSNSRYPFFYIFVHNRCVRDILPNFNLLRTTDLIFFGPLFPTINVENSTNLRAKAFVILMRTAMLIVITISTRVVFLRKWRHSLQFSTQTWNKEN